MKYFDRYLDDKEQSELMELRFINYTGIQLSIREKIGTMMKELFDLSLPVTTKAPTEKQLEFLEKQIKNYVAKPSRGYSAGLIEQGLGKTKSAIMWGDWLYQHGRIQGVVSISPGDLRYQWVEEQYKEHGASEWEGHIWEGMTTQREKQAFGKMVDPNRESKALKVFAINVEAMSHKTCLCYMHLFCKSCDDILVVIDESTTIKNGDRRPVPSSKAKRRGSKRANTILDGFEPRGHKMILSGTAVPNGPFDLWSQYEFLKKNFFGLTLYDFQKQYGEMVHVTPGAGAKVRFELLNEKLFGYVKHDLKYYGIGEVDRRPDCMEPFCKECGKCPVKKLDRAIAERIGLSRGLSESAVQRIANMDKLVQYKNLDELKEKMEPITFYCKTEECVDLPPKVFKQIKSSMSGEQLRVYKQMQADMLTEFEGETLSTLYKQVMNMRCQQIAGGIYPYPVELCKSYLDKFGEEQEKIETEYRYKYFDKNPKLDAMLLDVETVEGSIIYWARFVEEQRIIYEALVSVYGKDKVGWYTGADKRRVVEGFKAGEIIHFVGSGSASRGHNLQISHRQYFYSNSFEGDTRDQKVKRTHRMAQTETCIFTDMIMRGTRDKHILDTVERKIEMIDEFR